MLLLALSGVLVAVVLFSVVPAFKASTPNSQSSQSATSINESDSGSYWANRTYGWENDDSSDVPATPPSTAPPIQREPTIQSNFPQVGDCISSQYSKEEVNCSYSTYVLTKSVYGSSNSDCPTTTLAVVSLGANYRYWCIQKGPSAPSSYEVKTNSEAKQEAEAAEKAEADQAAQEADDFVDDLAAAVSASERSFASSYNSYVSRCNSSSSGYSSYGSAQEECDLSGFYPSVSTGDYKFSATGVSVNSYGKSASWTVSGSFGFKRASCSVGANLSSGSFSENCTSS